MSSNRQYTDFQLFVLAFLTTAEQKQEESGEAFGSPDTAKLPLSYRYVTTISELSLKIPPSTIPNHPSGKEMSSTIAPFARLREEGLIYESIITI
jgi:hypothetical protein